MNNELKTELLKALWIGHDVIEEGIANGGDGYKTRDSIRAAIAKLENEQADEIKLEEQGK